jgi:TonB family protein
MFSNSRSAFARILTVVFPVLFFTVVARSQTPDDVVHSFAGQKLILRGLADQNRVRVKKKDLGRVSGTCDRAVQVTQAAWNQGKALFTLVEIGTPSLANRPRTCKRTSSYGEGTLEISGFAADEKPDDLTAAIGQVLQSPEQYMAAMGASLNIQQEMNATQNNADQTPEKLSPAITAPKIVLNIDPAYSAAASRAKYQGDVAITVVIGPDGRIHDSKIARAAGLGLEESAINVLPLWRFEPARKDDKPVAVQLTVEVSFHLY